jgi:hypothetical protein
MVDFLLEEIERSADGANRLEAEASADEFAALVFNPTPAPAGNRIKYSGGRRG